MWWSSYAQLTQQPVSRNEKKSNTQRRKGDNNRDSIANVIKEAIISTRISSVGVHNSISNDQLQSIITREEFSRSSLTNDDKEQLRRSIVACDALRKVAGLLNHEEPNDSKQAYSLSTTKNNHRTNRDHDYDHYCDLTENSFKNRFDDEKINEYLNEKNKDIEIDDHATMSSYYNVNISSSFKKSMQFLSSLVCEVEKDDDYDFYYNDNDDINDNNNNEEKLEEETSTYDVDDYGFMVGEESMRNEYYININDREIEKEQHQKEAGLGNNESNNNLHKNSTSNMSNSSLLSSVSIASLLIQQPSRNKGDIEKRLKAIKKRNKSNSTLKHDNAWGTLNLEQVLLRRDSVFNIIMNQDIDVEDISYVRKPKLSKLAKLILTKKFHRYMYRFLNSQRDRTLIFPTLKQPKEIKQTDNIFNSYAINSYNQTTELVQTRERHRFIITADTQFGILMDGYAMDEPSWKYEVELSRKTVETINAMVGIDRPLFVCVCGDLVDTESSFSTAMASWKKVFSDWERHMVFEQQCKDFKEIWSKLHDDIALVCLCGNHDVGNKPTKESIETWKSLFGDDYLAFWVNGAYNIGLNNCLFSNPTGAPELFDEQLIWLHERLKYAKANHAKQIFVFSHFPWFIVHENEVDEDMDSVSFAPEGWGPSGTKFSDFYFNIPIETRKMALSLFKEYNVTACFSGHFHQNVVTQTSWGMPMIITGPLSMTLKSTMQNEFNTDPSHQVNGFRIVDCYPSLPSPTSIPISKSTMTTTRPNCNCFQHTFVPITL